MTDLTSLSLAQARAALRGREFSAVELADAHLAAMEKARALNAYVHETPDRAREMARASADRLAKGEGGPLEGLPIGVKDLFCTKDVPTTACSQILKNFVPTYESTVTANLWRDGAVLLGKLNNDEFAMGSSNETSSFWSGRVKPQGAARALTRSLCLAALLEVRPPRYRRVYALGATGTDTGGSIRQPAAFCGIKSGSNQPTVCCSRWGIVAFASSLDQAGPFARSVRDCAILLRSMAGPDGRKTRPRSIVRCLTTRQQLALRSRASASASRRNTGCPA